ncbi:MAG: hypothetical protein NC489_25035 [Ruminococcus flavefaciens]|nr:hypothetical protein [Ruminococcus flavefaciens]
MMKILERFPQIGGIRDYMGLPLGEQFLYQQYTLAAIEAEARQPVLRIGPK